MKYSFLSVLLLFGAVFTSWAFPKVVDGVYRIDGVVDLKGETVRLQEGVTLRVSGQIKNGTLVGTGNRFERAGKPAPSFDGVLLAGEWSGKITDDAFVYRKNADHYTIVASMMHFNEAVFQRKEYWIGTWEPVSVHPVSLDVFGNGVTFYITSDKGPSTLYEWGIRYTKEALFATQKREGGNLHYHFYDLHIADNAAVIGKSGWGHDTSSFRVYYYFGIIGRDILFENVSSDGGGALEKIYNISQPIDRLVFSHCLVKTVQFAVEVFNDKRSGPDYPCSEIRFDDCTLIQYPCQHFCGLVSIVGKVLTDSLSFRNCILDARARDGNLELTSGKMITMSGCTLWNTFLQSEENNYIDRYDCHDNVFHFTRHRGFRAFEFSGKHFSFKNNRLVYHTEKVGYITSKGGIDDLEIENNVMDCTEVPALSSSPILLSITDLAAKSGTRIQMRGNRFVDRSRQGSHRFQLYLPYVYASCQDNTGTNLGLLGYAETLSDLTSRRVTLRNYGRFEEGVFTVSTEAELRSAGQEEVWYFFIFRVRYALSLRGNDLVLTEAGRPLVSFPAATGRVSVTFSARDGRIIIRRDGIVVAHRRWEGNVPSSIEYVFVNRGNSYRVLASGFHRGGVLLT